MKLVLYTYLINHILSKESYYSIKGNRFIGKDSDYPEFFKGIVIQDLFNVDIDPLSDTNLQNCKSTAQILKSVGANSALVYRINSTERHEQCMKEFQMNNIRVMIGLSPSYNIPNVTYSPTILQSIRATIDEFIQYPNTLGYLTWVENNYTLFDTKSHQLQFHIKKAILRDIRNYIKTRYNSSKLPLLGSHLIHPNDKNLEAATNYLMCGDKETHPDFITVGSFQSCEKFSKETLKKIIPKTTQIPILFSEVGCTSKNSNLEVWKQMEEEENLKNTYSGGFFYQLYGSTELSGFDLTRGDTELSPALLNLSSTWKDLNPKLEIFNNESKDAECPSNLVNDEEFEHSKDLLQPPNWNVCQCALLNSPCIPSSQTAYNLKLQLNDLCSKNTTNCKDHLEAFSNNFSQCELATRIAILSTYTVDLDQKSSTSCPSNTIPNPIYLNKGSNLENLENCKKLWHQELPPILTHNTNDFFEDWPHQLNSNNTSNNSKLSSNILGWNILIISGLWAFLI